MPCRGKSGALAKNIVKFDYFSLTLDESCDACDNAQLLIFFHKITADFKIMESWQLCSQWMGQQQGVNIFIQVNGCLTCNLTCFWQCSVVHSHCLTSTLHSKRRTFHTWGSILRRLDIFGSTACMWKDIFSDGVKHIQIRILQPWWSPLSCPSLSHLWHSARFELTQFFKPKKEWISLTGVLISVSFLKSCYR